MYVWLGDYGVRVFPLEQNNQNTNWKLVYRFAFNFKGHTTGEFH